MIGGLSMNQDLINLVEDLRRIKKSQYYYTNYLHLLFVELTTKILRF